MLTETKLFNRSTEVHNYNHLQSTRNYVFLSRWSPLIADIFWCVKLLQCRKIKINDSIKHSMKLIESWCFQCLPMVLSISSHGIKMEAMRLLSLLPIICFLQNKQSEFATGSVTLLSWQQARESGSRVWTFPGSRTRTQYNGIWFIVRRLDRHKESDTDRELITDTMAHSTTAKYTSVCDHR